MQRLPLLLLMASGFLCTTAQEDMMKGANDALVQGAGIPERIIAKLKTSLGPVDEILRQAEKRMEEISEKIGTLGVQSTNMTKMAFDKYSKVKKSLRHARKELRILADKTRTACEELKIYLEGWDNREDNGDKKIYLMEQVLIDSPIALGLQKLGSYDHFSFSVYHHGGTDQGDFGCSWES